MLKEEIHSEILENQRQMLAAAITTDPKMRERLRGLVSSEIAKARRAVVNDIKFKNDDPRETRRSVHRTVYQRLLGGNINILDSKHGTARHTGTYEPPRKVYPGMKGYRGGNRMIRSNRTNDIMTLAPMDRGFILRFVNSGTHPRYANGRNGKWDKHDGNRTFFKLQEQGDYFRGSIGPRNFFGQSGQRAISTACNNLANMIEEEYNKLFNE